MNENPFKNRSPLFDKLIPYGFIQADGRYVYSVKILNGQFCLRVFVSADGAVSTELLDLATDEPYTLHLIGDAGGAFVGAVRAEYERVLFDISAQCFERDVFKSEQARTVIKYVRDKYGDELQYLWKNFPTNAIWRRTDNDKWYGALLLLGKRKLGLDSDETADIIDLRADPEIIPSLIDGKKYFAGYHMNKKHWITVCLDGSLPIEEIYSRIDDSFVLAAKK